jgi:D-methionine transport system permease protein
VIGWFNERFNTDLAELWELLWEAGKETAYMVSWSTLIAVAVGLPIGVFLTIARPGGLVRLPGLYGVLEFVVNVGRSLPFIILMVAIIPFTRAVVGTSIGTTAAIVPLAVASIPFFARVAENSLLEVDRGLVEMVQAMGGSTWDVVRKALVPEAVPSLVRGITITVINLIGYSAMAGVIGGGGLGDLAYRYGYQRFENDVMSATIIALVVLVQALQVIGNGLARLLQRR